MTPRPAILVTLSLLAACTSGEVVSSRESPIYWGDREDGYDGVVQITISFSLLEGAACSGTLVSPRVVVTAQHCVEDQEGQPILASAIRVHTGPTGGAGDHEVEEIRSLGGFRLSGQDFAVLVLAEELDAPSYPYVSDWAPRPGDPVTLVGYGQREDGSSGRKYRGDNTIDYVFDTYFTTVGEAGCHGDSGGPAFDDNGALVGVIVNTLGGWLPDDTCASGISGLTRVDSFHDLVDLAVADAWVCDDLETETCSDRRDNDCDMTIDEGCLEVGAPCLDGPDCLTGDCRDLGAGLLCSAACTPGAAGECPDGSYCHFQACGEGACVAGEAPEAPEDDHGCAPDAGPDAPDAGAPEGDPEPGDDSSGGCGCRAATHDPGAGASLALLGAAIALLRRRRRGA